MEEKKLRICHLYSDLLNLYGDRGNILAFIYRARLRGIKSEVFTLTLNDHFEPSKYDIVFFGGGQDAEQNMIRRDFVEVKGDHVRSAVEQGKVFLCVCGGYQMMGQYYQEQSGKKIDCLGALSHYTVGQKDRYIGDTKYSCDFLPDSILYGFENHSGRTYLGEGMRPLAKVLQGKGNNGEDNYEGAIYKNVYCTYAHGSFLPKNPYMTDHLLSIALKQRYGESFNLANVDSHAEEFARKQLLSCKKVIDK